jgi:hypothetical protein
MELGRMESRLCFARHVLPSHPQKLRHVLEMKVHKTMSPDMAPTLTPGTVMTAVRAARKIKATVNVWRENPAKKTPPNLP